MRGAAKRTKAYALAVTCLCGCVAFRAGPSASISSWPPAAGEARPTVSLLIEPSAEQQAEIGSVFEVWRDQTVRAYRESGLFSDVSVGLQPRDMHVQITIRDQEYFSKTLDALLAMTFGLIPCYIRQNFSVRTEFRARGGETLAMFERAEASETWIQLFLLAVMPFRKSPPSVVSDVIYDLNRATLMEALNNEVLWRLHSGREVSS
jgi:hypothetical protein